MGQRNTIAELFKEADVEIDGVRPWDIQIKNEKTFGRVLTQGSLGFGESYMDGWWDVERLDQLLSKVLHAQLDRKIRRGGALFRMAPYFLSAVVTNLGSRSRAFDIGESHYDVGNDLYERMLDARMTYTCGYWTDGVETLDQAQEAKLDLVCRKLGLEPGMRLLDIGCGWGSLAIFAAEKYGVDVVGVTVSKEQIALGQKRADEKGLPVELRFQDYRAIDDGPYDRIASLGMFEHVGYKNYRTYMETVRRLLKDDGLFLLHTIGGNRSVVTTNRWIGKYIFPNSMLPSVKQIGGSIEKLFVMEDWHSFGSYYDTTLMHWHQNVMSQWDELKDSYDERFRRMWEFYLMSSAASFRIRKNQLWQVVLSPHGIPGSWKTVR